MWIEWVIGSREFSVLITGLCGNIKADLDREKLPGKNLKGNGGSSN